MARKKSRPARRPAPSSPTAIMATPPAAPPAAAPPQAITAQPIPAPRKTSSHGPTFWDTPLGQHTWRATRVLASLYLAITLLTLFTVSLIVATLIESKYTSKVAGDLVYHTWWFATLLFF